MTRAELRTFIRNGVTRVAPTHWYGSGRISEFNSSPNVRPPFVWLVSPDTSQDITTTNAPIDNWSIEIHIGEQDRIDSDYSEYEDLIDDCDLVARQLMLNYHKVVSGYATSSIEGVSITPFIKDHAHCATGVVLSFTLVAPDTTSFC